ncbi:MAG: GIY-YIG nuclease family protein [Chitinophagaceae bacterium]
MVTAYIIESIIDSTWYTGMALDPIKRLNEHNKGKNRFTKGHIPWKIIYTEQHPDWTTARLREKYFKSSSGKNGLEPISLNDSFRKDVLVPCLTASAGRDSPA